MKILLATTVAAILLVALPTELQGAPLIASEEMGRVVEQVIQILASELNAAVAVQGGRQLNSYVQQPQYQESHVTPQVRGVNFLNCGVYGNYFNGALSSLKDVGMLVDCQEKENCVRVIVDAPGDNPKPDVRVCDLGEHTNMYMYL